MILQYNPIDEQGARSVESLCKRDTNHERLRTTSLRGQNRHGLAWTVMINASELPVNNKVQNDVHTASTGVRQRWANCHILQSRSSPELLRRSPSSTLGYSKKFEKFKIQVQKITEIELFTIPKTIQIFSINLF